MTWRELVREHFPGATDQLCDFLLWERTCFPCGSREEVEAQLIEAAKEQT